MEEELEDLNGLELMDFTIRVMGLGDVLYVLDFPYVMLGVNPTRHDYLNKSFERNLRTYI